MKWIEEISIGELPEDLRFIAESCGLEVVKNLLRNCAGGSFYLPKNPPRPYIERVIRRSYTGEAFIGKKLANKLGITENNFFKIVQEMEKKGSLSINQET